MDEAQAHQQAVNDEVARVIGRNIIAQVELQAQIATLSARLAAAETKPAADEALLP